MRIKTKMFEKHQQYVIVDFVAVYLSGVSGKFYCLQISDQILSIFCSEVTFISKQILC